jgi:phage terminase small subunit
MARVMKKTNNLIIDSLNDKQRAFCEEYIIDFNGAQAAIRAGYAEKTARITAAKLLTKSNIQTYLSELIQDRKERVKVSQDDVVRELSHIAFDDIKNYLKFKTEKVKVDEVDGKPIYDYKTIVDVKDSQTIDTRNIQEVAIATNGAFKFKLYGKDDALVNLGRHLGIFNDKLNLTGEEGASEIKISFVDKTKRNTEAEKDPKIAGDYTNPTNIKEG